MRAVSMPRTRTSSDIPRVPCARAASLRFRVHGYSVCVLSCALGFHAPFNVIIKVVDAELVLQAAVVAREAAAMVPPAAAAAVVLPTTAAVLPAAAVEAAV